MKLHKCTKSSSWEVEKKFLSLRLYKVRTGKSFLVDKLMFSQEVGGGALEKLVKVADSDYDVKKKK